MYLSSLKPNQSATITKIAIDSGFLSRLNGIGLTEGTAVKVIRNAPLGDPIEIEIRGFNLAIRRSLASKIKIDKVGKENDFGSANR